MTSTARAILWSADGDDLVAHGRSRAGARARRARDERPDLLAVGDPADVVRPVQVEDDDRQVVLHAQGHGGAVQHLELVAEQVRVLEPVVLPSARDRHRIRIVDPVDLGRLHQDLGADLDGAQRGGGVGREVRVAGAGHEDHDAALLEVADGAAADVRLRDLVHRDRAHDAGRRLRPLDRVLERQAVHDGREHADVVARRAVHALGGGRQAAEDVAAADDDADLDAARPHGRDLAGDERADGRVDAVLAVAEERLAGQLEQDPAVARRRPRADRRRAVAHRSSPSA